jgi:hypothetical protein
MSHSMFDREALARALEDPDPDHEHFLRVGDGHLWSFVVSGASDETRAQYDHVLQEIGRTWLRIPSRSSQETFEEMEDFVEEIQDPGMRRALFAALESKGAFRAFREFMLEHPHERALWEEFRSERARVRLDRFLASLPARAGEIPAASS